MHSLPPYAGVRDDNRLHIGMHMSHYIQPGYDGTWPIDPALYHFQFEQHQKELIVDYPQFQSSHSYYPYSAPQLPENSGYLGHVSGWNQTIDTYRNLRYNSPGGHFGGSVSESSSDNALSPEIARQQIAFNSPPLEAQYSQQSWAMSSSHMLTPMSTPAGTQTPSIALKELEFQGSPKYQLELQDDDLRTQFPMIVPEELELSDGAATLETSSRGNTSLSTWSNDGTDSSISSPAHDHDSDSDFDPRRRTSRSNTGNRHSNLRSARRLSSSSHPILNLHNRVHKPTTSRSATSKEKSKPKPLPQLHATSVTNTDSKIPKSFPCTFHAFGCPSTFANKNEWKRHVTSQHLQLGFYRCDLGTCNPDNNHPSTGPRTHQPHGLGQANRGRGHNKRRSVSAVTNSYPSPDSSSSATDEVLIYNDFNRKDLFTQHCRRMHGPSRHLLDNTTQTNQYINARARGQKLSSSPSSSSTPGSGRLLATKDDDAAFEEELDSIRSRCWTRRRHAPHRSSCGFCGKPFEASAQASSQDLEGKLEERAWEERMEHLGRHYERDGCSVVMEGMDQDLMEWGLAEGILERVENGDVWLVGCKGSADIASGLKKQGRDVDGDGNVEEGGRPLSSREGLRRRGTRRKVDGTTSNVKREGFTKVEMSIRTVKEEYHDCDVDAMAEDD